MKVPKAQHRTGYLAAAWAASVLVLSYVTGCGPEQPAARNSVPAQAAPVAATGYVGNAPCRDCHASVFAAHLASRHMATLHEIDGLHPGELTPPAGRVPNTAIVLQESAGFVYLTVPGIRVRALGVPQDRVRLQYAFGSGKSGVTYTALSPAGEMFEMRTSYFPKAHRWYLTPGHERKPHDSIGLLYVRDQARRCLLCHATAIGNDNNGPEPEFVGVGCEACHGPAGAHVAAMRAGQTSDLHLDRLTTAPAAKLIKVCAGCHRASDPGATTGSDSTTNRFQPYGLLQSRCYQGSRGTLSCVTCHDPHRDAATSRKDYEAACLKCHSPRKAGSAGASVQGKTCPVNAREKCIGCHMPARPVFPGTDLPILMPDHHIRVYRTKQTSRR